MELEHSFTVPVPKERAWDVLLDVERVAPCMPGATLDSVDGDEIRGRIKVKVGPISMTYAGTAQIVERDEANGVVKLTASGKETRGAGTASATVRSVLTSRGNETSVVVLTTLNVTGKPAQFGRGVLNEVGGKLLSIFANNLAAMLAQAEDEPAIATPTIETAAAAQTAPKVDAAPGDAAVEDLNLPARAAASLRKNGITTVGQLAAKTDEQVLAIDGIGPASVVEIKAKLAERGLALGQPAPVSPAESAQPTEPAVAGAPPSPAAPAPLAADTSAAGPVPVPTAGPGPATGPGAATGPGPATGPGAATGPGSPTSPGPATSPGSPAANGSAAANGVAGSSKAGANGARTGTTATAAARSASVAPPVHQDEALNLIKVAGMPVLKRSLPVLAGVTAVFILRWRRRLRRRRGR